MSDADWSAKAKENADSHAAALGRAREGEARVGRRLIAEFVQAAVAAGYDGLRFVDPADPTSLRETGSVDVDNDGSWLDVQGVVPAGAGVWGAVVEDGHELRFVDARDPAVGERARRVGRAWEAWPWRMI